jgi:S-adenosylmethionine:tRNA ribosyltransferase-isomerase
VLPARLWGQKPTGGKIEVLIERILDEHRILVHLRASKTPKVGSIFQLGQVNFEVLGRREALFELYCHDAQPVINIIEEIGEIPLPPYLKRAPEALDRERYQTVYSEPKGSVAAPTAGLHFDQALITQLRDKKITIAYLTLHVGAGTFAPVRVEKIAEHRMHSEYLEVSESVCEQVKATQARGNKVIAVGTTSMQLC